jgi:hypothetical protein
MHMVDLSNQEKFKRAGYLRKCSGRAIQWDAAVLARTVEAMVSGSMMTWAFYRKGPAKQWISEHIEAVLAPYITAGERHRRS